MSRGNWVHHPAIGVGIAIALTLFVAAALGGGQRFGANKEDYAQRRAEAESAVEFQPRVLAKHEKACAEAEQADRGDPEYYAKQDLCAQFLAAKAAERGAESARAQTWIGAVGLGGVVLTVFAAFAAVFVSWQTARRQLRAYVTILHANLEPIQVGKKARVTVDFVNSGQSPAYALGSLQVLVVRPFPDTMGFDKTKTKRSPAKRGKQTLGAGAKRTIIAESRAALSIAEALAVQTQKSAIIVDGEITYRDIFGVEHVTLFRMMHGGDRVPEAGHMYPTPEGNEAT